MLAILVERDDLHRDMTRKRIELELAQHRPSEHVGQEDVERNRGWLELPREFDSIGAKRCDQHFEALVASEVDHDTRVMRIVFYDQQYVVSGLDVEPIVGNRLDGSVLHDRGLDGDLVSGWQRSTVTAAHRVRRTH